MNDTDFDTDFMNTHTQVDAGDLPEAVLLGVRRSRRLRRMKLSSGTLLALAMCIAIPGVLIPRLTAPHSQAHTPYQHAAIMIDDPMFHDLDGTETPETNTKQWRVDGFRLDNWSLEM